MNAGRVTARFAGAAGVRWLQAIGLGLALIIIIIWPVLVDNNKFWVTLWAQVAILMLISSSAGHRALKY